MGMSLRDNAAAFALQQSWIINGVDEGQRKVEDEYWSTINFT